VDWGGGNGEGGGGGSSVGQEGDEKKKKSPCVTNVIRKVWKPKGKFGSIKNYWGGT